MSCSFAILGPIVAMIFARREKPFALAGTGVLACAWSRAMCRLMCSRVQYDRAPARAFPNKGAHCLANVGGENRRVVMFGVELDPGFGQRILTQKPPDLPSDVVSEPPMP